MLDTAPQMPTNGVSFNVVLDVWGGEYSGTHVARLMLSPERAAEHALMEVALGYLVNMRAELAWGPEHCFDLRSPSGAN